MKRKMKICVICIFCFSFSNSQTIKHKDILSYLGYKNFKLGMSLKEFKKIEPSYGLVNLGDSGILGQEGGLFSRLPPTDIDSFLNCDIKYIYYIFSRKKKLTQINWYLYYRNKDKINTALINLLGENFSFDKNEDIERINWKQDSLLISLNHYMSWDDSFSLSRNPNFRGGTLFVSLKNSLIPDELNYFTLNKKFERILKSPRTGIGNGSFNLSLASLEKIVMSGINSKGFEKILHSWQANTMNNWASVSYDNRKKDDKLFFHLAYDFQLKDIYGSAIIEIEHNIDNEIKCIEVTYPVSGKSLAKFKNDLILKGYYFDELLTNVFINWERNFGKWIYVNETKNTIVTITSHTQGYSFKISKSK